MLQVYEDKLNELDARVIKYFYNFVQTLLDRDRPFKILEVYRSQEVQDVYYAQGREPLVEVNARRKELGLYQLPPAEDRIITHAKKSTHTDRCAMDLVPRITMVNFKDGRRTESERIPWNLDEPGVLPLWEAIVRIGVACGLEAGAKWQGFADWPHYQKII